MIDIEKLDKQSYTNKVVQMYEELNTELVNDVLKKIKKQGDFTSVTRHQLKVLANRGGKEMFKEALKKTNLLSAKRKQELLKFFEEVVNSDLSDYKILYDEKGLPYELSEGQLKIFNEMVKLTDGELNNYTQTIAFSAQKDFVNTMDSVYKQVVTGGTTFNKAFRKATNELASKGITLTMKNGKKRSIEAAVRQNLMYGLRQTTQLINDDLVDYLDADAVQINISRNCRPTHKDINGRVFSLKRNNKHYPYFKKEYQELLGDYNCQHYKSPFIIGVSEPIYTDEEINEANNRTVNYNGKEIPYYEATQKQRALERAVRSAKKTYMSSQTKENKAKISKAQKKVRDFLKETGLERNYDREYFAGYNH